MKEILVKTAECKVDFTQKPIAKYSSESRLS